MDKTGKNKIRANNIGWNHVSDKTSELDTTGEKTMKLVLWDWNGTLLDDIDASIVALNIVLKRRHMAIVDKKQYKRIFMFPVIEYYKKLGFNFEIDDFDIVAREYIAEYAISMQQSGLFPGVIEVLGYLKSKGYGQSVLSAMQQSDLMAQIQANGVFNYFQDVIGLKDIYAVSKIENAIRYIKKRRLNREDVCLVGDTYHDYEVAKSIGCTCILISKGHQDLNNYSLQDAIILEDIQEVRDHIA
jgi:phosphoglycolate phosphatase